MPVSFYPINLNFFFLSQYALAQKMESKSQQQKKEQIPEFYENGILQRLTNFYEVKGMEVYASTARKEGDKLSYDIIV